MRGFDYISKINSFSFCYLLMVLLSGKERSGITDTMSSLGTQRHELKFTHVKFERKL